MDNHSRQTASADTGARTDRTSRVALSIAAAWLMSLGFDLILHGGILARLYTEPGPFLLGPADAFRRIPLGYLAFLVLTAALYWLFDRLGIRGAIVGFRYAAGSGAVLWLAFNLGLYSITTATLPILIGWWVGQTIELGLAGAVLGAARNGVPLKRIWIMVLVAMTFLFIATVGMQSIGLAPAAKISK